MWCNGRRSAILWRICRIENVSTPTADGRPTEPADGPGHRLEGFCLRIGLNGLRLHHNFMQFAAPFFWLLSRLQMGFGANPRGPPDMTAQSTTAPGSVLPHG